MLEVLTRGFRNARLKLQGKAELSEDNIAEALRDVRVSMLEGDVEVKVVRDFLDKVKTRALGEVVKVKAQKGPLGMEVTAGDHFIKICHDELIALMQPETEGLSLVGRPAVIMMVGLQGSGKTTTAGKLARQLAKEGRRPLLVAADIYRPAAIEQLTTLGRKIGVPVFSIKGMKPLELSKMALTQARNVGRDVVIIDTAGRLAIDEVLMAELEAIKAETTPDEILFVCDAMIGQDAVRTAVTFDQRLSFSGFVLTKMDGDARGGAALSIRAVTGKPVRFVGMGEALDKLEPFRADGLASRILGFGDVVGLVKDFEQHVSQEEAEADAMKMLQGQFTYDDFLKQLAMIQKMGSLKSLFERLPFFADMVSQLPEDALDDGQLTDIKSIIQSMTFEERRHPDVMNKGRFQRIAKGSGHTVAEVESLHERFKLARQMMGNIGQSGLLSGMLGGPVPGGGNPMANLLRSAGMAPPKRERPTLSRDEKLAKREKAKAARKARKK